MKTDGFCIESYDLAVEEFKITVKDFTSPIRLYTSLPEAVFEVVFGAALFLSHKKNLGYVAGMTSVFDLLWPQLLRLNYQVHKKNHHELTSVNEWVSGLPADTAMVLLAKDHRVLGQSALSTEELIKNLSARRIFSVCINHHTHFSKPADLDPYTIRINSLAQDLVVVEYGEKFKAPPLWSVFKPMHGQKLAQVYLQSKAKCIYDKSAIQLFQKHESIFWRMQPSDSGERVVLVLNQLNSEAVVKAFIEKATLQEMGFVSENLLSLSPCAMKSFQQVYSDWWQPQPPSAADWRGMMVVSAALLQKYTDFARQLQQICESLQQQQTWSV
ncbi:MAG: hypothetical protein ACOYOK_11525 [Pseudobdellovibrionaceae bacterium]